MSNIEDACAQYASAGLSVVLLRDETKRPVAYGWQSLSYVSASPHAFEMTGALGIVCGYGGIVVVDIDEGGCEARKLIERILGKPFAVTTRRNQKGEFAERWKLLYRQDMPDVARALSDAAKAHYEQGKSFAGASDEWRVAKKSTFDPFKRAEAAFLEEHELIENDDLEAPGVKIQVLSFGRQAAVPPSIHHTGFAVEWEGGTGPTAEDIAASEPITREMIDELRKELGCAERRESGEPKGWDGPAVKPALVISALCYVPNGPDVGYAYWRDIGFACHSANSCSLEIKEAFREWSAQHPSHKNESVDALWENADADRLGGITVATLFSRATKHGWDHKKAALDVTLAEIESATIENDVEALKAIVPSLADPVFSDMERGQLTNALEKALKPHLGSCKAMINATVKQERMRQAERRAKHDVGFRYPELKTEGSGDNVRYLPRPDAQSNTLALLDHLGKAPRFNEFTYNVHLNEEEFEQEQLALVYNAAQATRFFVKQNELATHIDMAAQETKFHPVRDYLDSLEWDGKPRLDGWLPRVTGCADTELNRAIGKTVLVGAVRMVRQPGSKFDLILTLKGTKQGEGKGGLIEAMAVRPEWFGPSFPLGADDKIIIERANGMWIVEFGEMAQGRKAIEQIKDTATRKSFVAREAYARKRTRMKRQFIIIASTNEDQPLVDTTGNRRFLPVEVGKIDIEAFIAERDQLYAEACAVESQYVGDVNLPEHLWEAARIEQEASRVKGSIETRLHQLFEPIPYGTVRTNDVYRVLELKEGAAGVAKTVINDVARFMKALGWSKAKPCRLGGKRPYCFRKEDTFGLELYPEIVLTGSDREGWTLEFAPEPTEAQRREVKEMLG